MGPGTRRQILFCRLGFVPHAGSLSGNEDEEPGEDTKMYRWLQLMREFGCVAISTWASLDTSMLLIAFLCLEKWETFQRRCGGKHVDYIMGPTYCDFAIFCYIKSDHSLVVEIKGTKIITNKRLKEWPGWRPTSAEEELYSKWKMIRKDRPEVGRYVHGEGLVEVRQRVEAAVPTLISRVSARDEILDELRELEQMAASCRDKENNECRHVR